MIMPVLTFPLQVSGFVYVAQCIVNDMLPLSTVESPSFKKSITALLSTAIQLPDRKSLLSYLERELRNNDQKGKGSFR